MANPIKFTELPLAGELSSSAIVAIVQEQNGEQVSLKCSVAQVAQLIADGIEFAGLTSNDKRIIGAINEIMNKVDDLELFKFPNATIIGTPTINNGQISGFSQTSYLQFPFLMDFQGRHFAINMEFTTAADVTNQQNIFDSDFGLAFAIRSGKFVIAVSSNGTSWNIGEGLGTHTVLPNTTYRVQLAWDGTAYKLAYSVNGGESYTEDISLVSTASPFPKQVYIGVGENYAAVLNFFKGIINLNYASLFVADSLVWQGMDDVGLASRLATDLSNIDAAGEQRIKDIAGGGGDVTKAYVDEQDDLIKDSVTELNEQINGSKVDLNIIDGEYSRSSDGRIVKYDGWSRTDYIDITGYTTLEYAYTGDNSRHNCFYDENKTFVTSFNIESTESGSVNVPANAKYFVVSATTAQITTFKWLNGVTRGITDDIEDLKTDIEDLEKVAVNDLQVSSLIGQTGSNRETIIGKHIYYHLGFTAKSEIPAGTTIFTGTPHKLNSTNIAWVSTTGTVGVFHFYNSGSIVTGLKIEQGKAFFVDFVVV